MRKLNGRENSKRNNIIIFVFITILFIGAIVFLNLPKNEDISYTQLVSYIEDGKIEKLNLDVTEAKAEVVVKGDDVKKKRCYSFSWYDYWTYYWKWKGWKPYWI